MDTIISGNSKLIDIINNPPTDLFADDDKKVYEQLVERFNDKDDK